MMIAWITSARAALQGMWARLWLRKQTLVEPSPPPPPEPEPQPQPEPPPKPRKERGANSAAGLYFRGAILDKLDTYFEIIDRMKRGDRQAYDLFSKVGAQVLSSPTQDRVLYPTRLPPWFMQKRPGFGAVFYIDQGNADPELSKKWMWPKMFHFQKYARRGAPRIVQPTRGEVYLCTAYFDEVNSPRWVTQNVKRGVPVQFPVAVMPDGEVHVLKLKMHYEVPVRHKVGKDRGKEFTIPRTTWGFDEGMHDWAAEHQRDAETHMRGLFCAFASLFEYLSMASMRIIVRKRGLTGVFGINMTRSAYFFRDRDKVVAPDGHTKRIFHVVAAHKRQTKKGTTAVRLHFRGLRRFTWNGYQIDITVPGIQGDLTEFDVGSVDESRARPGEKYIDMADYAEHLSAYQLSGDLADLKDTPSKTWVEAAE